MKFKVYEDEWLGYFPTDDNMWGKTETIDITPEQKEWILNTFIELEKVSNFIDQKVDESRQQDTKNQYFKYVTMNGKTEKVECKDHSYAWSGKEPCTGKYCCIFCGKEKEN